MILDLGAAIGKLLGISLPSVLSLQISLHDLGALSIERTSTFRNISAEVMNWRLQAVTNLDLPTKSGTLLLLGSSVTRMPRCVKLNNYWCIKRAGWQGELGADSEGHVAFDTAEAGARAAAFLLRRYYLEFGRRSALAIVSRWAPNRCIGGALVANGKPLPTLPFLTGWQRMSKEQKDQAFDRLIAERRRVAEARYKMTTQAIAAAKRTVSLAGTKPKPPVRVAATPAPANARARTTRRPAATLAPISCALEAARISSYAHRAIAGIAATPNEDLQLFDERGVATWRLTRLMENMSSVEIGPQRVVQTLVPAALEALSGTVVPNPDGQAVAGSRRSESSPADLSRIPPS